MIYAVSANSHHGDDFDEVPGAAFAGDTPKRLPKIGVTLRSTTVSSQFGSNLPSVVFESKGTGFEGASGGGTPTGMKR